MTVDELKARMDAMTPEEKEDFKAKIGHAGSPDEVVVQSFVAYPDIHAKVCYQLGVPSQPDKVAAATFEAAWYAKAAFVATVVIGIPSLIVAVIALLK